MSDVSNNPQTAGLQWKQGTCLDSTVFRQYQAVKLTGTNTYAPCTTSDQDSDVAGIVMADRNPGQPLSVPIVFLTSSIPIPILDDGTTTISAGTQLSLSITVAGSFRSVSSGLLRALTDSASLGGTVSATMAPGGGSAVGPLQVIVNNFPGAPDIGAQINAADTAYLGVPIELMVLPGDYNFATMAHVTTGHGLALGDGLYDNTITTSPVIVLDDHTSLRSAGQRWGATIKETANRVADVTNAIMDYKTYIDNTGPGNSNISVTGIAFARKAVLPDGISATLQFGNISDVLVANCRWDGTSGFCVSVGGSSAGGYYAKNFSILNNTTELAGTQNIAVVNGINFLITENTLVGGGADGRDKSTFIDIEPNTPLDRIENFIIANNIIDARGGTVSGPGTGIKVAGSRTLADTPSTKNNDGGIVTGNRILGGALDQATPPVLAGGIFVGLVNDLEICNNYIYYLGQGGVTLEASDNCRVHDNDMIDCGPVSTVEATVVLNGSRWCKIYDNSLSTQLGSSYYAGITELAGAVYGQSCDFNKIYDNELYFSPDQTITDPDHELRIVLVGANSREWNNQLNGQTFGVGGVDSIAALRAGYIPGDRPAGVPATAWVIGQATPGDWQPVLYYYDPTSAAADNGLTVIKPANQSGNGRWLSAPRVI